MPCRETKAPAAMASRTGAEVILTMQDIRHALHARKPNDDSHLLGCVEIVPPVKRVPKIKARDAAGKQIGIFKTQRAALTASDVVANRC